jgi:hypothetical protein
MSLPSTVIFYKEDKEIRREFINCGWICNEKSVKNSLERTLLHCGEDFDWDVAEAYGMKIMNKREDNDDNA